MFNLRLCNATTIQYSLLKFGHMHLCGKGCKCFSPHCCKCNSFGCITAIRCGNACHGPHSDSVYSGSEHGQFNSPRLVKREADFPNPQRALIGSNQFWRVNDSPYYREYMLWYGWKIKHSKPVKVMGLWAYRDCMGCSGSEYIFIIRRNLVPISQMFMTVRFYDMISLCQCWLL